MGGMVCVQVQRGQDKRTSMTCGSCDSSCFGLFLCGPMCPTNDPAYAALVPISASFLTFIFRMLILSIWQAAKYRYYWQNRVYSSSMAAVLWCELGSHKSAMVVSVCCRLALATILRASFVFLCQFQATAIAASSCIVNCGCVHVCKSTLDKLYALYALKRQSVLVAICLVLLLPNGYSMVYASMLPIASSCLPFVHWHINK